MNIDWATVLVGALIGSVLTLVINRLIVWSRRVKLKFLGFEAVQTNFGTLYKMRFRLNGHEHPGECRCEIKFNSHTTFAKWDETPNPLRDDGLADFVPDMVPMTIYYRLHAGSEYRIPIVVSADNEFFVFDGWWFGRSAGYYNFPALQPQNTLDISVRGSGFVWSRTFRVEEIVETKGT